MKTVKNCWIQDANTPRCSKKGSKILKLPPVRNCFTLAMTNKFVFNINNLKVPKIKKLLLYEMKFLVPNYSCLQNPWLGGRGLPPPDPRSLSSTEFCWTPFPEQNSWVRHCLPWRERGASGRRAPPIPNLRARCSGAVSLMPWSLPSGKNANATIKWRTWWAPATVGTIWKI